MIYIVFLLLLAIIGFTQTRILYHVENLKKLQAEIEKNKQITTELYIEVRRQGRKSA